MQELEGDEEAEEEDDADASLKVSLHCAPLRG